jgi:hypothetical protein
MLALFTENSCADENTAQKNTAQHREAKMNYHLTNSCEVFSIQDFTMYLLSDIASKDGAIRHAASLDLSTQLKAVHP